VNATLAFNLFTAVHVLLPFRYGSFGISSDEFCRYSYPKFVRKLN
jgi:hypothetical protein